MFLTPTIYSFGDAETLHWGLHGVAMLFDPANTNILTGYGLLGLGTAVGLGLLIALLVALLRGIQGQTLAITEVFLVLLICVILLVPKTDVQIEDYYTGQVYAVDNVPIGIAYPGALFSGLFVGFAEKLDTIFQMADSYYPTLSEQHFLSSLSLIATIDTGIEEVKKALSGSPFLKNLDLLVMSCIDTVALSSVDVSNSRDVLTVLTENVLPGGLVYAHTETGIIDTNCPGLATIVQQQADQVVYQAGVGKPDFLRFLIRDARGSERQSEQMVNPGSLTEQAIDVLDRLMAASSSGMGNAASDLMTLVLAEYISGSLSCAAEPTVSDYNNCIIRSAEARNRMLNNLRARSFGLQHFMLKSMNLGCFLFYSIGPVVGCILALLGLRGLKAAAGYAYFGVTAHSPLLIAPLANFWTWKQAAKAFGYTVGSTGGITLSNASTVLGELTDAVTLGSNMMGMGSLVLMSLLMGGGVMLARLTGAMRDSVGNATTAYAHGSGMGMNLYAPPAMLQGMPGGSAGVWGYPSGGGGAGVFGTPSGGGEGVFATPPAGGAGVFNTPSLAGAGVLGGSGGGYVPHGLAGKQTVSLTQTLSQQAAYNQAVAKEEAATLQESFNRAVDAIVSKIQGQSSSRSMDYGTEQSVYLGEQVGAEYTSAVRDQTQAGIRNQVSQILTEQLYRQLSGQVGGELGLGGRIGRAGDKLPIGGGVKANLGVSGGYTRGKRDVEAEQAQRAESSGQDTAVTSGRSFSASERSGSQDMARLSEAVRQILSSDKRIGETFDRAVRAAKNYVESMRLAQSFNRAASEAQNFGMNTTVDLATVTAQLLARGGEAAEMVGQFMSHFNTAAGMDDGLRKAFEEERGFLMRMGYAPDAAGLMAAIKTSLGYRQSADAPEWQRDAVNAVRADALELLFGERASAVVGDIRSTVDQGVMDGRAMEGTARSTVEDVRGEIGRERDALGTGRTDITPFGDPERLFDLRRQEFADRAQAGFSGALLGSVDSILGNVKRDLEARTGLPVDKGGVDFKTLGNFYSDMDRYRRETDPTAKLGLGMQMINRYGDEGHRKALNSLVSEVGPKAARALTGMESGGGFGSVARRFESGGNLDAVSVDAGGRASYGRYQMYSGAGTPQSFVRYLAEQGAGDPLARRMAEELGKEMGSVNDPNGAFAQTWKRLATDPETRGALARYEQAFVEREYYGRLVENLERRGMGMDLKKAPEAVKEALFSTAVQHGVGRAASIVREAWERTAALGGGWGDFVRALYDERARRFPEGAGRYAQERNHVLAMLGGGASGVSVFVGGSGNRVVERAEGASSGSSGAGVFGGSGNQVVERVSGTADAGGAGVFGGADRAGVVEQAGSTSSGGVVSAAAEQEKPKDREVVKVDVPSEPARIMPQMGEVVKKAAEGLWEGESVRDVFRNVLEGLKHSLGSGMDAVREAHRIAQVAEQGGAVQGVYASTPGQGELVRERTVSAPAPEPEVRTVERDAERAPHGVERDQFAQRLLGDTREAYAYGLAQAVEQAVLSGAQQEVYASTPGQGEQVREQVAPVDQSASAQTQTSDLMAQRPEPEVKVVEKGAEKKADEQQGQVKDTFTEALLSPAGGRDPVGEEMLRQAGVVAGAGGAASESGGLVDGGTSSMATPSVPGDTTIEIEEHEDEGEKPKVPEP